MIYKNLGHSNIKVSTICLGTMTWGEQNTENEAFQQMDMAFDYGVNFFDTAELYPIPPSEKTQGETSRIISRWIKSKNNRNKIIIADKIVGRSKMDWFRDARFGMFIHYGLYSQCEGYWNEKPVRGIGEWIFKIGKVPVKDYKGRHSSVLLTFDAVEDCINQYLSKSQKPSGELL